ncbi:MAG: histidine kinase dimerization/phospho-acceptor domain-containing protein [Vicinamibacterales bacterium]
MAAAVAGRPVTNVEVTLTRAQQKSHTLLVSLVTVAPEGGAAPATLITIAVDTSERRLLEEQHRQSQKIEAVGRLAGGVAHDFNNLLTVIIGYNETLDFDDLLGESAKEAVRQIRLATDRATMLTRQLLAFSRRQVLQPQTLDLRDVARQLAPMMRRLMGEDVQLTMRLGSEPAVVRADPGQIEQVLMNLAVNARDAMPTGGRFSIEIGPVEFGEDFVAERPYVVPGTYAQMLVSDTGTGMSEDTRARVFEPFLHHQAAGPGHGPRPRHGLRHRQAERRCTSGWRVKPATAPRSGLPCPWSRPKPCRSGRRLRYRARLAAPKPSCSWKTRTRCASSTGKY